MTSAQAVAIVYTSGAKIALVGVEEHPLTRLPMSASAWHTDVTTARILCVGADLGELIQVQCVLDGELDFVIITSENEMAAALSSEAPFDIIIMDKGLERLLVVDRLRRHSPEAERLLIIRNGVDPATAAMIESDCRVMRLLRAPLAADLVCDAVADALLRHRARALRASAVPRVTPMGGNPCCTATSAGTKGTGSHEREGPTQAPVKEELRYN